MNIRTYIVISLLFNLCMFCSANVETINRHALLIGIGAYPVNSGWEKLAGANDVAMMKSVLVSNGFDNANIITLLDEKATKKEIIKSAKINLLKKVSKGDVVVFYFSGHGQQIMDDNKDENDGLDEAIVSYDSPKVFQAGKYEGENLIKDDELGDILNRIRKKLGSQGQLLVLLDACHSGTLTRGSKIARGAAQKMGPKADLLKLQSLKKHDKEQDFFSSDTKSNNKNLSPFICLTSSSSAQNSYEIIGPENKQVGLFTYAFCKNVNTLNEKSNYLDLYNLILLEMTQKTVLQTPLIEGHKKQLIFGMGPGRFVQKFRCIKPLAHNMILADGGLMNGLTPNTRVAIYPLHTTDTLNTQSLASGVVTEAAPFDADIQLDRSMDRAELEQVSIFIQSSNFLLENVKVKYISDVNKDKIQNYLERQNNVSIVLHEPDFILKNFEDKISFYDQGENFLSDFAPGDTMAIIKFLQKNQYANHLRKLHVVNEEFQTDFVLLSKSANGAFKPILTGTQLTVADEVKIQIKNNGQQDFYFSIIEILEDSSMENILPGDDFPADYFVPAGKTYISESFNCSEPFGMNVLKLIATSSPMELNLLRSKKKKATSEVEVFLRNILLEKGNSSKQNLTPPKIDFSINTFLYEIVN